MMLRKFFAFVAIAALTASPAIADLAVYNLNYDSVTPTYHQFDFGGTKTLSITSGGASGNGAKLEFDNTGDHFSLGYFAEINPTELNTPTSANASDYVLSFDVKAEGLESGISSAGGQVEVWLGDAHLRAVYNATDTFTTLTFNLGGMTVLSGTGPFDLADVTTSAAKPRFKANVLGVSNKFGTDTGNVIYFDNFQVTQLTAVPEPGAIGILALTVVGLVSRRRRV